MGRIVAEYILLPMLNSFFTYKLWSSEDELKYRQGKQNRMYTRGKHHLSIAGNMLKVLISNRHDPPHSSTRFEHLPSKLRWKNVEVTNGVQSFIRKIIHTSHIHSHMKANLKCDLYDIHLKFPR